MAKILIASDMEDTNVFLPKMLQDEGHTCLSIPERDTIIDTTYREEPEIVILDTKSLHAGALKILTKLKSAPSTWDIPIILIASKQSRKTLANGYNSGAYDYISRPFFREEVLARIRNILDWRSRMKQFEQLLTRDFLTGLYNRKFFMERLEDEIKWSVGYKDFFSLLILDLDHFKKINDTMGHSCGDEILRQVAEVFQGSLKPQHLVARYGGEEFAVLMPNTQLDEAIRLAESLRAAVENKDFSCYGDKIPVTISIGVSAIDGESMTSMETLINKADEALYAAKNQGRNRVIHLV